MQSTINPSTHIRPLGEEHLRMFRRMTQEGETVPKIVFPKEAIARTKVVLSDAKVTYSEAENTAKSLGGRLATLMEVIVDLRLMEYIKIGTIFVDWRGEVPQKEGLYYIDRKRRELILEEPIGSPTRAWHEDLHVFESTFNAIRKRWPLAVYGDHGFGGAGVIGVDVSGKYDEDYANRVAFVKG